MKAFQEVDSRKTLRFILYSFLQVIYHWLLLPPVRKLFLVLLGAKIGDDSIVMGVRFFNWHQTGPGSLEIGKECFIGDETLIDLYDKVTIKNQVTIAQRVTILTHLNVGYSNHPLQKFFPKASKPVIFEPGSVVAANSTILPGVTVGSQSFVAAGSVVTENVPPHSLVAGVPAKVIRELK